ncbi:hypothetical protein D3C73_607440 [compost metagenome]
MTFGCLLHKRKACRSIQRQLLFNESSYIVFNPACGFAHVGRSQIMIDIGLIVPGYRISQPGIVVHAVRLNGDR